MKLTSTIFDNEECWKGKDFKGFADKEERVKQEEAIHQECVTEEKHEARSDISNNDTDNNGVEDE